MQSFWPPTRARVVFALTLLGISLGFLGVGVSVQAAVLAGICYAFAFAFFAGAVLTLFWPKAHSNPELETQERWRRQETLDTYFNLIQQWLEDENRPLLKSGLGDQRRKLARTQTRWVLKRLDPNGKRDVLEFLWEHKLIKKDGSILHPIVRLSDADLSNAHLANIALYGSNLDGVNLSDADLSGATLCWFVPVNDNPDLRWPQNATSLSHADLIGTVLRGTILAGCSLVDADFDGAVLDYADLSCADLQQARNLTQEQVNQAYGTYQQNPVPDTKLPPHIEVPRAWKRPLRQQMAEKRGNF